MLLKQKVNLTIQFHLYFNKIKKLNYNAFEAISDTIHNANLKMLLTLLVPRSIMLRTDPVFLLKCHRKDKLHMHKKFHNFHNDIKFKF